MLGILRVCGCEECGCMDPCQTDTPGYCARTTSLFTVPSVLFAWMNKHGFCLDITRYTACLSVSVCVCVHPPFVCHYLLYAVTSGSRLDLPVIPTASVTESRAPIREKPTLWIVSLRTPELNPHWSASLALASLYHYHSIRIACLDAGVYPADRDWIDGGKLYL